MHLATACMYTSYISANRYYAGLERALKLAADNFDMKHLSCSGYIETNILCGQLNARCTTCRRFD